MRDNPTRSEYFTEAMQQPVEMAEQYPITSMLVVFGVGVGVGTLLAHALAGSPKPYYDASSAEKVGKQLYSAFMSAMPQSVTRHFS